ncbi:Transient receptor potential cation channel subfamily M member 5 [Chelonia mydas]|uniref:Transient receptor potential cation channel subfamily M member 5 n=1 Tax=Chelonia mydas TaxID=8469 RepID=M7BBB2_CHEMY|nr:Transient receptor potential cation channel subfamily M member 5 [Chelonia mydas]
MMDVCPLFSLYEVSRVLKDFLHDACKGFYQEVKPGSKKKADKTNAKRLPGLLDMNQKSENPWRDLFLWAVLQNRHKMANYFWAMGQEGVAAALAACKILKDMSRLETEAEVARRMKEAKYDQLALELFSECYHNSEERAFALLVRKNQYWSKTTCLHLATEADAKSFFAHDGVQSFFTDEDMNLIKKFKLYVEDNWNKCDMVAIFLFIIGVTCRMLNSTFQAGRTVLAIDFMVFALRLIHIFAIHKQLGPKIIIVERMMKDVFFFLFFLSVWLIAYGVTTQALLHPDDSRVEWIFRRVLYRPYLQIFGQIPLDEIDRIDGRALGGRFIASRRDKSTPAGSIAACRSSGYTFQVIQGNADIFWKFQRYNLIVEYHGRPALAPPFIIISHMHLILQRIFKKMEHKKEHRGFMNTSTNQTILPERSEGKEHTEESENDMMYIDN